MANRQRGMARERHWREVFTRFGSSGLTVRAFCQQEGIRESAFYSWRRTLRERGSAETSFVPVVVDKAECPAVGISVTWGNGRSLRLPAEAPAAHVAALVHAIEASERSEHP